MSELIPYQEVKLENQSVDEIVEDIGILKKIEEASKFEIGRRLVYLKETCKHGEYLPKLEEVGISRATASVYINFYCRFGQLSNVVGTQHLGYQKIRELLRIPKGSEEEYLDKIPDPNEITAKQLREEIEKLKQEKEQERLAKETVIKTIQELQDQIQDINSKRENDIKSARDEGIKIGRESKIDEEKEKLSEYYREQSNNEVTKRTSDLKKEYQDRLTKLGNELDVAKEQLDKYEQLDLCEKDIDDRLRRQTEIIEELSREEEVLESWGTVMSELDIIVAKINVVSMSEYSLNNTTEEVIKKSALYCSKRLKEIYNYLDETFNLSELNETYINSDFVYVEGE